MKVIASDFETGKAYVNRETEEHLIILQKLHLYEGGEDYVEFLKSGGTGRYWVKVMPREKFRQLILNDVLIPLFPTMDRGATRSARPKQTIMININL